MHISQYIWATTVACASLLASAKVPSDLQKEQTNTAVTAILCKKPYDFTKSSDYLIFLYTEVESISKIQSPEKQKEQMRKLIAEYYRFFKNSPTDSARAQSFIASLVQEHGLGGVDRYSHWRC